MHQIVRTQRRIMISVLLVMFALILGQFAMVPETGVYGQTAPQLSVNSQDTSGMVITGYYAVLYGSSGNILTTGFTPATFTLVSSQTYSVRVDNYGSCSFQSWTDGSMANPRTVSITSNTQMTAVYNCAAPTGGSTKITVNSQNQHGNGISGYYTILYSSSGSALAKGFTPQSFTVNVGTTYGVRADSYGSCVFAQWSNGVTSDPITITPTSAGMTLTAVYNCGGGVGGPASVTVNTVDMNNNPISGYYTILYDSSGNVLATGFSPRTFTQIVAGDSYSVRVDSYGSCVFAKWSSGVSSDPMPFTATSGQQSFTAIYNCGGGGGGRGNSSTGITVTANRIPASYWAPCFALVCSRGTGPGATMFFTLYNSSGAVVATGFADEHGFTFTGLNPNATYYVYPADCDSCHGSTHDVLFQYWANSSGVEINSTRPLAVTAGETVNAWYSCTNGCGGS